MNSAAAMRGIVANPIMVVFNMIHEQVADPQKQGMI
jgi:hypothetical protein